MTHKIYINAYFIVSLHLFLSLSLLRVSSPHMPAVGSVVLLAILADRSSLKTKYFK